MISTHWFTRFRHYLVSVMNVGLKKLSHTQALAYTQRKREGERSGYCWQYQSITLRLLLSVASTNYVSSRCIHAYTFRFECHFHQCRQAS